MQDNYPYQTSFPTSDQTDWKTDDIIDSGDEKTDTASSFAETKFRSLMTQREMEVLTTWFPKAARALACVLRNRPE